MANGVVQEGSQGRGLGRGGLERRWGRVRIGKRRGVRGGEGEGETRR